MNHTIRARFVAAFLALGVFTRHVAVNWLDLGISKSARFYIFGAAWETILCAVILLLAFGLLDFSKLEPVWKVILQFSMVIGMVEGAEIIVCRPALADLSKVPEGVDVCDYLLGFPFGKAVMVFYFLIFVWIVGRRLAKPTS